MISLDTLDRKLLAAMQEDCTLSAEALAERCATSSSTALRRLGRLRAAGVIRKEVALIDAKAVGRNLMMIVNIRSERGAAINIAALTDLVASHPAVMQFYFVTGPNDYVAILSVGSMEEYDTFMESMLAVDPKLLTDTNVVIRPVKMGLAVLINS